MGPVQGGNPETQGTLFCPCSALSTAAAVCLEGRVWSVNQGAKQKSRHLLASEYIPCSMKLRILLGFIRFVGVHKCIWTSLEEMGIVAGTYDCQDSALSVTVEQSGFETRRHHSSKQTHRPCQYFLSGKQAREKMKLGFESHFREFSCGGLCAPQLHALCFPKLFLVGVA